MDPKQIAKQMIDFNKTAFDNTFNALISIQDQTEKMVNSVINQNPMFPEEGKKAINEWLKMCKRGREDFKAAVDDNYKKVETYLAGMNKGK